MIAVKPGTDAWGVLQLVVDRPGELDAEVIGEAMWRPRIQGTYDVLRVQASIRSNKASWTAKASDILHRLQARGFVERIRPPQLHTDLTSPPASDEDLREWAGGGLSPTALGLLARLVRHTPGSMLAWVGLAPAGGTLRAVADLVECGLVVPPSRRWPTDLGAAWITTGTPRAAVSQRARASA